MTPLALASRSSSVGGVVTPVTGLAAAPLLPLALPALQHLYNQFPALICFVLEMLKVVSEKDPQKPLKGQSTQPAGAEIGSRLEPKENGSWIMEL